MKNIIFLFIIISLTSCSTVNKLFHKEKRIVDSVSVTHEKKDSTVIKDSIAVHKSQTENTDEIVVDYGDKQIVVPYNDTTNDSGIYITPKNSDDYFYFNSKTGEIKGNKTPLRITIRRRGSSYNLDSLADHSQITVSDIKDDSVRLQAKEKTVNNEVHKTRTFKWWWFVLLGVVILGSRWIWINRSKIKSVVIHFFTGL